MARVALVAPSESLRDMLVTVAAAGTVEIDTELASGAATDQAGPAAAVLAATAQEATTLAREGRQDLLAGERQLRHFADRAVRRHGCAALAGWTPVDQVGALRALLTPIGSAVVVLRRPRGAEPPTLVAGSSGRQALSPLVSTYGTVPYPDVNPAWLAWAAYVLMFGMMFGDVGHGLLLIAAAIALRAGWPASVRRYRGAWPFVAGAGLTATIFGFAYGEFFGPTGVLPALWLSPIARPLPLLAAGLAFGAVLLAGAYTLGVVNRWREGGWRTAFYAPSGVAGSALFLGAGLLALGWYRHAGALLAAGTTLAVSALLVAFAGFLASAGGGGYGVLQAVVEVVDLVIRLGSNIASFARLAAFGLAHAALGLLVWDGTRALWHRGGIMVVLAGGLLIAGNALAFALEGLVAAVQAIRLEYYELFSRVFVAEGRPFRPWRLRIDDGDAGRRENGGGPVLARAGGAVG
ncbi:MAG TPA: V-type ATPase 116kDa subunit family protein [Streptosporangiaceae bacterium]|nr:V-type ATPase 116kDa subunit family protein [Streptosporangiaceae bacterium]